MCSSDLPAMMGAAVFAQRLDSTTALGTVDTAGVSVREALSAIDYLGTDVVSSNEFSAYLETHIEQGPSLEASKTDVAIVSGVQGMRWHRLVITGVSGHAGTYPLESRSDALVAAAHVITGVREAGLAYPDIARATVGWLEVEPNSPNVIPGVVRMNVEFRHPDPAVLDALSSSLDDLIGQACEAHGVDVINERVLDAAPVLFDQQLLGVLESAANQAGVTSTRMMSGAGHDAVQVSHVVPTAMLFIPCVDGVSHAEHERITPEWAQAGAQVLLNAVLTLANS